MAKRKLCHAADVYVSFPPMYTARQICQRIKLLRLQEGLSTYRAAALSGIGRTVWAKYELEEYFPCIGALERIAQFFGIGLKEILSETPPVLTLTNDFVLEVLPIVKRLTDRDKEHILEIMQGLKHHQRTQPRPKKKKSSSKY